MKRSRIEEVGGDGASDFDHEHDRILGDLPGVELSEGIDEGSFDDGWLEEI